MSLETLEEGCRLPGARVLLGPDTRVVWHPAGLAVPVSRYRAASQIRAGWPGGRVRLAVQANAALIDDAWCAFFRDHDLGVGVRLDGPREATMRAAARVQPRQPMPPRCAALRPCGEAGSAVTPSSSLAARASRRPTR